MKRFEIPAISWDRSKAITPLYEHAPITLELGSSGETTAHPDDGDTVVRLSASMLSHVDL